MARKVIVDIGSGSGERAVVLARKHPGSRIIGIDRDVQPAMRGHLHELRRLKNVRFRQGDFLNPHLFKPGSVDEIEFNFVKAGWPQLKTFNNAARWLKPAGSLVVREWPKHQNPSVGAKQMTRIEEILRRRGFRVVWGSQMMNFKRWPMTSAERTLYLIDTITGESPKYRTLHARRGPTVLERIRQRRAGQAKRAGAR